MSGKVNKEHTPVCSILIFRKRFSLMPTMLTEGRSGFSAFPTVVRHMTNVVP